MGVEFWLPTAISIVAIIWSYIQSRSIERLKNQHARQVIVSKLQFEKEFEVYKDIWSRIVDLRQKLLTFSPDLYQILEHDQELRKKSIQELGLKYLEVCTEYEKAKPFYSKEIYLKIEQHLESANNVFQWNIKNDHRSVLDNWELLDQYRQTILKSTEEIGEEIRARIGNMHVHN